MINRGYFARACAVDLIVHRFASICRAQGERCQVVNLGAGLDSTFWRIYSEAALAEQGACAATGAGMPALWVEVDFPEVTARKAATIRGSPAMAACCAGMAVTPEELAALAAAGGSDSTPHRHPSSGGSAGSTGGGGGSFGGASGGAVSPAAAPPPPEVPTAAAPAACALPPPEKLSFTPTQDGGCEVRGGSGYHLVVGDLRNLEGLKATLASAGVDRRLPTLFLSECVLVYLEPGDSCAVIAWTASAFKRAVFVTYEQVRCCALSDTSLSRVRTHHGLRTMPTLPVPSHAPHHMLPPPPLLPHTPLRRSAPMMPLGRSCAAPWRSVATS